MNILVKNVFCADKGMMLRQYTKKSYLGCLRELGSSYGLALSFPIMNRLFQCLKDHLALEHPVVYYYQSQGERAPL